MPAATQRGIRNIEDADDFDSRQSVANVKDFGAIGDGVADDSAAIQAACDSFITAEVGGFGWSRSGGTVFIPPGEYLVNTSIMLSADSLRIVGNSGPGIAGRNTFIYSTGGVTVFELVGGSVPGNNCQGFTASGFDIIGVKNAASEAFRISTGDKFKRDFLFDRVGIHRFGKAIVTQQDGGDIRTQVGMLRIEHCSMKNNLQALVCEGSTSINECRIVSNEITNNNEAESANPVIDIRAFGLNVSDNILEGQKNALRIRNSIAVAVQNNFYEEDTGHDGYAYRIENSDDIRFGPSRMFNTTESNNDDMYEFEGCKNLVIQEKESNRINLIGSNTFVNDLFKVQPKVISQAAEPSPGTGDDQVDVNELAMWVDTDDSNKLYLVFNQAGTVKSVLLT